MIEKESEGVRWLEFDLLQEMPKLRHGVFLRHGGVSQGPFSSLNMTVSVGDDPLAVRQNKERVLKQFTSSSLVFGRQVHGDRLCRVLQEGSFQEECDGLFTSACKKALMIQHADCQAAIFYDPIHHLLATIHAGWRGSVQNIYGKTIQTLKGMGSNPADLLVCISPSLGPSFAEFIHFKTELPPSFQEFQIKENMFDFWAISRWQLESQGILSSHIEIASICTYANPLDYFSYRRDKITGRHATIAELL